jgi:hypothetical protein
VVALLLRSTLAVPAIGLLLVGALVIAAGAGEYPLFARPGLRYLLLEALPPLLAGVVALATWVLAGTHRSASTRALAGAVVAGLLARAAARFADGAPPAAWLELAFLAMLVIGIVLLELVRRLPGRGD